eukprot:1970856-Amphidinium_carterae.1
MLFPMRELQQYLQTSSRGQAVEYKHARDFIEQAQAASLASYLAMFPQGCYHALLAKGIMAYCPPG